MGILKAKLATNEISSKLQRLLALKKVSFLRESKLRRWQHKNGQRFFKKAIYDRKKPEFINTLTTNEKSARHNYFIPISLRKI